MQEANMVRFEHQQEALREEEYTRYKRSYCRQVCTQMWFIIPLIVLLSIAGSGTCGGTSKGVVIAAIIIKGVMIFPVEFLYIYLLKKKYILLKTLNLVKFFVMFLILGWQIYIVVSFFSPDNNCDDKEVLIYIAHLLLVIEWFAIFIMISLMWCCICWLLALVWCIYQHQQKDKRRNIKIKDILLNAASLKLNLNDIGEGNSCAIWLEDFKAEDKIIRLPWDKRHHFHADCIGQWIETNASCPICKTQFNEDTMTRLKDGNLDLNPHYNNQQPPQNSAHPQVT